MDETHVVSRTGSCVLARRICSDGPRAHLRCRSLLSLSSAGVETEVGQLTRIFSVLGTPSAADWPNVNLLGSYIHFKPQAGRPMHEIFPALSEDATDLLAGLLTLNPLKRLTATEALAHRYFMSKPAATPLAQLPKVADINAAVKQNKANAEAASAAAAHVGKASGRMLPF